MKKMVGLLGVLAWILPAVPLLAGGVDVWDPWVQEEPPSMQALMAYMVIRNTGAESKTMVGVSTPLFAKVEIHETLYRGDRDTMVSRNNLIIDAKSQQYLKPGGYHLMLIAPQGPRPLRAGDKVPLVLRFSDGSQLLIRAKVRKKKPGSVGTPR